VQTRTTRRQRLAASIHRMRAQSPRNSCISDPLLFTLLLGSALVLISWRLATLFSNWAVIGVAIGLSVAWAGAMVWFARGFWQPLLGVGRTKPVRTGPPLNPAPFTGLELRAFELFANGMRPMAALRTAQLERRGTVDA
jgi:hypothetical protein